MRETSRLKTGAKRGDRTLLRAVVASVILACGSLGGLLLPQSVEAKTVTITTGTDPGAFSAAPGATSQLIDNFSVSQSGGGTGGITQVVVTTTGTANLSTVYITDGSTTTYGSSSSPSGKVYALNHSPRALEIVISHGTSCDANCSPYA